MNMPQMVKRFGRRELESRKSSNINIRAAFLFGESVKSLRDTQTEEQGGMGFAQAFNEVQIYIQQRFRLGDFYWMAGGKKFRAACKAVHNFADRLIDHGLNRDKADGAGAGGKKKYVFLDTVAEAVKTRDALRGQAINILAAGRDTTAGLLSWVL